MMRIIAGQWRGRRLSAPPGKDIRPTTDRMRERLFSILQHGRYPALQGARVLDLFAGTGALGLEALSRGAAHVHFVEKAPASIAALKANIDSLDAGEKSHISRADASHLKSADTAYDIIFMDAPYRTGLTEPCLQGLIRGGWLAPSGVILCEIASDEALDVPENLELVDSRSQGQQRILFLMHKAH